MQWRILLLKWCLDNVWAWTWIIQSLKSRTRINVFVELCCNLVHCVQVSRSGSVPPNTRDALYQGLPPNIKSALRSKLQSFHVKEEVNIISKLPYTIAPQDTCVCFSVDFYPGVSILSELHFHLTICLQLTIPQIKAEMERTLQWLVPIASNTTK